MWQLGLSVISTLRVFSFVPFDCVDVNLSILFRPTFPAKMNGDDIRFRYVRMTGKEELNKPFQNISGSNPIQSEILYFLELDQNQPDMAWLWLHLYHQT